MSHTGEVRRMDRGTLILSLDGKRYKLRTVDIKNVISESQPAAQVWEMVI